MSSLNDIVETVAGRFSQRGPFASAGGEARERSFFAQRLVRKFARLIDVMAVRLPNPKRGVGSMMALMLIAGGWYYGASLGGSAPAFVSGAAATFGLKATDIVITGQVETSEQEIFNALGVGRSLVGFSAADARDRLMALDWVRDAAVRKHYPGKLTVALAEKRPMAVWQVQDRLTVVDRDGNAIAKFGIADLINARFSHLPHLVGDEAAQRANEILPLVARHPDLAGRVKSYQRIGSRRWDMQLDNGMRIQLPEDAPGAALDYLDYLASEDRLLEREIAVVDLRLKDRVVLRLEPAAAKARTEFVAARLKAMKKADRKL